MRYEAAIKTTFRVVSVSSEEMQCICPWHPDRSGKLYVNARTGLYLCMRCGAKGSLDRLSEKPIVLGSDDVREKLEAIRTKRKPTKVYPESWLRQFDIPHPYWEQDRRLPTEVIEKFCLGYDPLSNRMTIPLRNVSGDILGVTYRRLDGGKPKYLHPKGFPTGKHLFGAWHITNERRVALVEGQVDAIRCWSERVPALGLMGARITPDQKRVLRRLGVQTVVLMLDNDAAGYRGTIGIEEDLKGSGLRVLAGRYRDYWVDQDGPIKDPDGLAGHRLRKMFHSATDIHDWAQFIKP